MTINELVRTSHKMAIEKGWWENERSVGELIALVHSELSEALEEARKGVGLQAIYYREGGKPEGFGIELADAIIRIADICGYFNIPLDDYTKIKMDFNATRHHKHGKEF